MFRSAILLLTTDQFTLVSAHALLFLYFLPTFFFLIPCTYCAVYDLYEISLFWISVSYAKDCNLCIKYYEKATWLILYFSAITFPSYEAITKAV